MKAVICPEVDEFVSLLLRGSGRWRASNARRALRALAIRGVVSLLVLCAPLAALADARTDFFVRMLGTSSQFRVRAQAALALGGRPNEAPVRSALSKGLKDDHPAVRAASASALEQLADPVARPWLEAVKRDPDPSVRAAVTRALASLSKPKAQDRAVAGVSQPTSAADGGSFYVAVGVPSAKSAGISEALAQNVRSHLSNQVLQIAGVRLAPSSESNADAQRVIGQRRMTGYHLESSITSLELRPDGSMRAQVSVVVATYPGRDIRSMLTGAATVTDTGRSDADKLEVISAAFTGALRRLPQAMQAGLARAQ